MAETRIQNFTQIAGILDNDLLHLQRLVDGVWTDFCTNAQGLSGSGITPQTVVATIPCEDLFDDAIINILPDISGSSLGYVVLSSYLKFTPGNSDGLDTTTYFLWQDAGGITAQFIRYYVDMSIAIDQASPGAVINGFSDTAAAPGLWFQATGMGVSDGEVELVIRYFIIPSVP